VAVKRFWVLQVVILVSCAIMLLSGLVEDHRVLGFRAVCSDAAQADPCWLTFGGFGAISIGMGVGLVCYSWVGIGILFGVGQATCGLIAFGQLAVGPIFFCGQLGVGMTGLGQVSIGGRVIGQGELGASGSAFLRDLNTRLDGLLAFR
jgi:hypothetical protein